VHIVLAEAAIAIGEADDEHAAALLRAALAEYPLVSAAGSAWFTDTCMTYVLVPEERPALEVATVPPRMRWAQELAAIVAAGREGSARDRIATLSPVDPPRVRGVLPAPFAAEFAVALDDAGRVAEATALLAALGESGRVHARRLSTPAAKALLAAVPAAPAVAVRIQAFGVLRVDGLAVDRVRVRELLGYLLLHPVTTRAAVTALLWPDLDDRAAANNLRVALSHLLRLLEPERTEGEAAYFVQQSASELRLVVDDALDVDVDAFDAALRAAATAEDHGSPSVALEHYLAASELYGGELLADLPDVAWADLERERGRTRFVAAAVRAGELLAASNDPDGAEQLAQRARAVDEWSEPAYGVLASAAIAPGERAAALRIIERCHEMLDELGVEVSDGTARLARRARAAIPAG
ncbi:MAG: bacterial transcriptional activator domain-containing protein, partial [Actinomycetota bacterium]|nr:bacterial transcriptional activator domain-containing protein [Actinomycetota bacterium]